MSKPTDKSKDQVRIRRQRNLVAKDNRHKGGYHSANKYERLRRSYWSREALQDQGQNDVETEYNDELH